MSDTPRHAATQLDATRHTLTVREVEAQLLAAGVPRSHRHVERLCKNQAFDAVQLGPNDEWFVAPDSVQKVIGDLRALDQQRARRDATQRGTSQHVVAEITPREATDTPRHAATQHDASAAQDKEEVSAISSDTSRYVALLERDNEFLRDQVQKKDEQIFNLSSRFSETQTLLGAMQRMFAPLLGQADPFKPAEKMEVMDTPN